MNLTARYDADIAAHDIIDDPLQRQLLQPLEQLVQAFAIPERRWFDWRKRQILTGFYLYGPVGVGKTFMMDLFYNEVSLTKKKRCHFHHFMQQIDAALRRLQGQKNPLKRIAADLARSTRLLCFDEFMVEDVAHAMILAELLQALFDQGVVLFATSNRAPEELYLTGPHRERFLPAIEALNAHCQIHNLGNKRDYRLGRAPSIDTYMFPLGEATQKRLTQQFDNLAPDGQTAVRLMVQHREIMTLKCAQRAVWFDFNIICNLPRSQLDYLEIANRFDTVFVSNIPILSEKDTVFAILLIHFVDVMYDQGIRLILSAEGSIEELYQQGEMMLEFRRTFSRLQEMQSADYRQRHPRRCEQTLMEDYLKCE